MTRRSASRETVGELALSVREQFSRPDQRDVCELGEIVTVDDLRRQRLEAHNSATASEYALTGLPEIHRRPGSRSAGSPRLSSPLVSTRGGGTPPAGGEEPGTPHSEAPAPPPTPAAAFAANAAAKRATGPAAYQKVAPEVQATLQSARHLHDKPELYERMVETMGACEILRDNRQYRLNSLGVFSGDVNTVRARTMHRVDLHKELSTTSLRLPSTLKDVKPTISEDSVVLRLERMYNRVLQSVEEPAPKAARSSHRHAHAFRSRQSHGGTTMNGNGGGGGNFPGSSVPPPSAGMSDPPSSAGPPARASLGFLVPPPRASVAGGWLAGGPNGVGGEGGANGSSAGGGGHPTSRVSMGGNLGFKDEFAASRVSLHGVGHAGGKSHSARPERKAARDANLPPEMVQAQLVALQAATAANLQHYHQTVAAAEDGLMDESGLGAESIVLTASELDQKLMAQMTASRDTLGIFAQPSPLSPLKIANALKLNEARGVRAMIAAALEHVDQMETEFEILRPKRDPEPVVHIPTAQEIAEEAVEVERLERVAALEAERAEAVAQAEADRRLLVIIREQAAREAAALEAAKPVLRMGLSGLLPPVLEMLTADRFDAFRNSMQLAMSWEGDAPRLAALPPAPTPSLMIQARLERVWRIMQMPVSARLDMVLRYTSHDKAMQFESTLGAWEEVAAAMQRRELLLGDLVLVQQRLEASEFKEVSLAFLERTCIDFTKATRIIDAAGRRLLAQVGEVMTLGGEPYPGAGAVDGRSLMGLMTSLREAARASMIRVLGFEPINTLSA